MLMLLIVLGLQLTSYCCADTNFADTDYAKVFNCAGADHTADDYADADHAGAFID